MKAFLLLVIGALALNVQASEVKKDTIDKYVIDKKNVERFDGTQLEGKTISKYIIACKDAGDVVERMHVIYTDDKNISVNGGLILSGSVKGTVYKGLVIVDGREIDSKDLNNVVKTGDIFSVTIHKPGSKVAESYGEKGEKGVMVIVTKTGQDKNGTIYFVDGIRTEKEDVDKIVSEKIASIDVNKKDGVSIIQITTK